MWSCDGGATSGETGEKVRVRGWDNGLDSSRATGDESKEVVGRARQQADSNRVGRVM